MAGYEDGAAPPGDGTGEGDAFRNEQLENEHADATDRYGDDPSPRRLGGMSRRRLLLALGVAGAAGVGGTAWAGCRSGDRGPVTDLDELGSVRAPGEGSPHDLAAYEDNVRSGGPPPDGIPSIDEPVFVPVDEVDFLRDEDIVFGWVKDGRPRGYSQLILVPLTGYYREGSGTIFPVMADDDRFDRKEVFLGAKLGEHRLAVRKRLAIEDRVVEAELGDTPVVFL